VVNSTNAMYYQKPISSNAVLRNGAKTQNKNEMGLHLVVADRQGIDNCTL
jgi:hypothetical protein